MPHYQRTSTIATLNKISSSSNGYHLPLTTTIGRTDVLLHWIGGEDTMNGCQNRRTARGKALMQVENVEYRLSASLFDFSFTASVKGR